MTSYRLRSLRTGRVAPLGPRGVASGITKQLLDRPVVLTMTGLAGDEQGDTRHHGGIEKAVHHYPFDHYDAWIADIGAHPLLAGPGAFGENLSTDELTEADVAVGDVFSLGSAIMEVSQGRQPCWRLNERFDDRTMARRVQATGRTGWYYRVLASGVVAPTDTLELISRHSPQWTIHRIWRVLYEDTMNREELEGICKLPKLSESWRNLAARRLEAGSVEGWAARLDGVKP